MPRYKEEWEYAFSFWKRVERTTDCWIWHGRQRNGRALWHYPRSSGKNCGMNASRAAWIFTHGPLDDPKVEVCHTCDNGLCVNPKHLCLGTDRDNKMDMASRNRQARGKNPYPGVYKLKARSFNPETGEYRIDRWVAVIGEQARPNRTIGWFKTLEEAILARQIAEAEREDRWRESVKQRQLQGRV